MELYTKAQQRTKTLGYRLTVLCAALSLIACSGGGSGTPQPESVALPTDYALDLQCATVGIASSTCVLDDPNNPYARSIINDGTKWDLNDASPSAKAKFYLWATALAVNPTGENQFYTALALHDLYTQGGSELVQTQAQKAYRSVLDNYYDSVTYVSVPVDFVPDQDFSFGEWGSGSQLDGAYRDDPSFTRAFQVISGTVWGDERRGVLAFTDQPVGFSENYKNLVFKVKDLPSDLVFVQFGDDIEQFEVSQFGTPISDKPGWYQMEIPLSIYPNRDQYDGFAIMSQSGMEADFLLTDIAMIDDATGNGLVGDDDGDGLVYYYSTDANTMQAASPLKDLAGQRVYDPSGSNLLPLFQNQDNAEEALSSWGYVYDPNDKTIDIAP